MLDISSVLKEGWRSLLSGKENACSFFEPCQGCVYALKKVWITLCSLVARALPEAPTGYDIAGLALMGRVILEE